MILRSILCSCEALGLISGNPAALLVVVYIMNMLPMLFFSIVRVVTAYSYIAELRQIPHLPNIKKVTSHFQIILMARILYLCSKDFVKIMESNPKTKIILYSLSTQIFYIALVYGTLS
jgi:hypothetical protein